MNFLTFNFKFTFILILIFITIYLLCLEFILIEARENEALSSNERTNNLNNTIKDILFKYVPGAIAYYTFIDSVTASNSKQRGGYTNSKSYENTNPPIGAAATQEGVIQDTEGFRRASNATTGQLLSEPVARDLKMLVMDRNMFSNIQKEINNSIILAQEEKVKAEAMVGKLVESSSVIYQNHLKIIDYKTKLLKVKDLKIQEAQGVKLDPKDLAIINREHEYETLIQTFEDAAKREKNRIQNDMSPELKSRLFNTDMNSAPISDRADVPAAREYDIKKSAIFSVDWDYKKFMSNLSEVELLALGNLIFNQLILSYTISIITILYGDYLIKRFELEKKYPKIAKIIQLRRKLQGYYLKINFA